MFSTFIRWHFGIRPSFLLDFNGAQMIVTVSTNQKKRNVMVSFVYNRLNRNHACFDVHCLKKFGFYVDIVESGNSCTAWYHRYSKSHNPKKDRLFFLVELNCDQQKYVPVFQSDFHQKLAFLHYRFFKICRAFNNLVYKLLKL